MFLVRMLLPTNNSDYDTNDPTNVYLAQLYAAQQQAAASLVRDFYPTNILIYSMTISGS